MTFTNIRQFVSCNFPKSEIRFDWLTSWCCRCLGLEAAGVRGPGASNYANFLYKGVVHGEQEEDCPEFGVENANAPKHAASSEKKIIFPPQTPSPVDLAPRPEQSHLDPRLRPAEFMPNLRLGPCSRADGR